jgi:hypothetical protein
VRGIRRREKFIGHIPKPKRGAQAGTSSCWWSARVAARAGSGATCPREVEPAGLGERRAGELGARWRRKSSEGAAGGRGKRQRWAACGAAEKQRGESRRKKMRTCS